MADPGGGGMYAPVGWVNSSTPGNATVKCGNISQTEEVTADGSDTLIIPFVAPATWSDNTSWITEDGGLHWICVQPGIYMVQATQSLIINNPAEIVNPVVNLFITVDSGSTSEFNQTIKNSILCPATTVDSQEIGMSVSGLINADAGAIMTVSIISPSGNIGVISSPTSLPNTGGVLSWNLIAQGQYGNSGVIV